MSNHALTWAWKQNVGDQGAKLLLIKLADQANDDGVCWPSRRTLATELEVSDRTITRHTKVLSDAGLIEIQERHRENGSQASNVYLLRLGGVDTRVQGGETGVSTLEPSLEPRSVEAKASTSRQRDEIWEALTQQFGEPLTSNERKRLNGVCGQLRGANALPEQIPQAVRAWALEFPEATLTDTALAKHWTRLVRRVTSEIPGQRLLAAARVRGHT